MKKRFKLYTVDIKYIRSLHKIDDNVPSVSPQVGKQTRPFLGIVLMVHGSQYCIPLSSNSEKKSPKYEIMKENITFKKIKDKDGKILAALNINNMIPVHEKYLKEIDLQIKKSDSAQIKNWKKLCIKELNWCQSHQDEIEHLANELYRIYSSSETFRKRSICLNFPLLEKKSNNL